MSPPGDLRFRALLPEPRRLWIAYHPADWPAAGGLWIDLASLGLGRAPGAAIGRWEAAGLERLDDVVYLPPVAAGHEGERRRLAARLGAAGVPCRVQVECGGEEGLPGTVFDLTAPLVAGELRRLRELPRDAEALWPWIAGLTDREQLWREGLELLRRAGVRRVAPLPVATAPRETRRLAEATSAAAYEELFHRRPASTLGFAQEAHRLGMTPLFPRPLPVAPRRLAANRRLAGHLAQIGELELVLGRDEVEAQAYFRAARWIDRQSYDLEALAREGNLGVLEWLEPPVAAVAEEFLQTGASRRMSRLEAEYLETGTA